MPFVAASLLIALRRMCVSTSMYLYSSMPRLLPEVGAHGGRYRSFSICVLEQEQGRCGCRTWHAGD